MVKPLLSVGNDPGRSLEAALFAHRDDTWLLYRLEPYSYRSGLPDITFIDDNGARLIGCYGMDWEWKEEWMITP